MLGEHYQIFQTTKFARIRKKKNTLIASFNFFMFFPPKFLEYITFSVSYSLYSKAEYSIKYNNQVIDKEKYVFH